MSVKIRLRQARFYAEPVGVKILKTERGIKSFCISIAFYNLQICFRGTFFAGLGENGAADCAAISFVAAACVDINGIKPYVTAIHDAKAGGHHAPVDLDACYDRFFWDCLEHRRDDTAQRRVGSAVQAKERSDPVIRDAVLKQHDRVIGVKKKRGKSGVSSIIFVLRAIEMADKILYISASAW